MALWGKTDTANDKPKYLSAADKAATVGVDVAEATTAANIAKGINKPGWVKYTTYTDGQGNTRHKAETLVAFSSMTGDNDTIDPDPVITIDTQPLDTTLADGEAGSLIVAASTDRDPVTLSYQWQVSYDSGSTWADLNGMTNSTLALTGALASDGNQYRVVVSATGAASVTSNAITLTVTP